MSDNIVDNTEEDVSTLETRFAVTSAKLVNKEPLTNEEGMDLLRVIAGLNANSAVTDEIMFNMQDNIPKLLHTVSDTILRRVGRTDQKIRKSVSKICDSNLQIFWDMIRMHAAVTALDYGKQLRNENEDNSDNVEGVSE